MDDSQTRWILQWYRFDPERNERRYVTVAAYNKKREFDRAFRSLSTELDSLKAEGLAEVIELISGVEHKKDYRAEIRRTRELDRQKRQDG